MANVHAAWGKLSFSARGKAYVAVSQGGPMRALAFATWIRLNYWLGYALAILGY